MIRRRATTELEPAAPVDADSTAETQPPPVDPEPSADTQPAPDTAELTPEDDDAGAAATTAGPLDEDEPDGAPDQTSHRRRKRRTRVPWTSALAYVILPAMAVILALGAGYLKWQDGSASAAQDAAAQSVQAATDTTIAMLSYQPTTVDKDLGAARDRLTGQFKDDYTSITHDVVVPGSQQKHIGAAASVPAAASVSATRDHAVVLVFVNQTTTIGNDPPSNTASAVRVTLDKVQNRWLVSQFDPI